MDFKELERRAAEGEMNAQYELAMKLVYGEDVPEDNVRAAQLLEEAAQQGHREAAYHLGVCYHYGHGVEVDLRTAYQLYLRAFKSLDFGYANAIGVILFVLVLVINAIQRIFLKEE